MNLLRSVEVPFWLLMGSWEKPRTLLAFLLQIMLPTELWQGVADFMTSLEALRI